MKPKTIFDLAYSGQVIIYDSYWAVGMKRFYQKGFIYT